MVALLALACAPPDCAGEVPTLLYGTEHWDGVPGVASIATWGGPGVICEATCDAEWAAPSLVWGLSPCTGQEGPLRLVEGDSVTLCVVVAQEAEGLATCTVVDPGGELYFEIEVEREIPPVGG